MIYGAVRLGGRTWKYGGIQIWGSGRARREKWAKDGRRLGMCFSLYLMLALAICVIIRRSRIALRLLLYSNNQKVFCKSGKHFRH